MKQIGVWLDREKAYVMELTLTGADFKTINSNMGFYNLKSGSQAPFK